MDLHASQIQGFFDVPVDNVSVGVGTCWLAQRRRLAGGTLPHDWARDTSALARLALLDANPSSTLSPR